MSGLGRAYELLDSGVRGDLDVERLEADGWKVHRQGQIIFLDRNDDVTIAVLRASAKDPAARAAELVHVYLTHPRSAERFDPRSIPRRDHEALETLGADFDDDDGVVETVRAASEAAYEELHARCVIGDAALAKRLKVNPSRISQRAGERSLYWFVDVNDQRCYPEWQFVGNKGVQGLKIVLAALDPDLHPLTVDRWFTRPDVDLAIDGQVVTPLEWLKSGGSAETVASHARFV